MHDEGSYKYINGTVTGGCLVLSGTINNPGNNSLPPGIVVLNIYSSDGSQSFTPDWVIIIQDFEGMIAFVGIQIPEGDITVSPSLNEIDNLYNTEQAITFTKADVGSITFNPGLNIMDDLIQLEDLQITIVSGEDSQYYVEVNTEAHSYWNTYLW